MTAYTSEREIRARLQLAAARKAKALQQPVDQDTLGRWVTTNIDKARDQRRLMTDRQLADHKAGRTLDVGDYARYVGPTRDEPVGDDTVTRETGQLGRVVAATKQSDATVVVTFRPVPNPLLRDEHVVELVVKQGTPGYLDLERLDPEEVA